jgi:hypothetical protein
MRVDCPRCGRVNEVERLERGADEFCFNCDYPLFWATLDRAGSKQAFAGAGMPDASLRRLPGVGGDADEEGEACRRCGELNRLEAKFCDRCGLEFDPAPAPPPSPPKPEPEVQVLVVPAPAPEEDYFIPIAAAVAAGVALVLLLGLLVGLGALAVEAAAVIAVIGGYGVYRLYRRRERGRRSAESMPQGSAEGAQDGEV